MNGPRICVVSGADEIRYRSYINHTIYAREHGLDYRLECGLDLGIENKFFYKTSIIRRVLPLYDWILWIDDDAYFTDFASSNVEDLVSQAEEEDHFLVIANGPLEPNGFWSKINTGVFLIRNDADGKRLLELMRSVDLAEVRDWWNDDRDGVFTSGDQDQMWWALNTTGLIDRASLVDHALLNSRGHYYVNSLSDAFVMHFCGHWDKELGVAKFAKRFDVGQELVPEELLDKYSAKVRSPMSEAEFIFRDRRMSVVGRVKRHARPWVHRYRSWIGGTHERPDRPPL